MAVHEGVKKLWMYLIPLSILAIVAIFGEKWGLLDLFDAGKAEEQKEIPVAVADSIPETLPHKGAVAIDTTRANNEVVDTIIAQKQWRLVVGSLPSREQAEQFRKNIGHPEMDILYVDYIPTYRIVYKSFINKKDAQEEYQNIQSRFPKTWLVYY